MKKHLSLLIILFFFHGLSFAGGKGKDKVMAAGATTTSLVGKIVWGPEIKKPSKRMRFSDILASDESGTYIYSKKVSMFMGFTSAPTINCFNKDMSLRSSTVIDLKVDNDKLYHDFSFYSGQKIYSFGSRFDSKTHARQLFYILLDKKTGLPQGTAVKVAELVIDGKVKGSNFGKGSGTNNGDASWDYDRKFSYAISPDSSKILIMTNITVEGEEKHANTDLNMKVFDKDMHLLWEKVDKVPYSDKLFVISDYIVDNDGGVHVLAKIYKDRDEIKQDKKDRKEKGEKKAKIVTFNYSLFSYLNKGKDTNEKKVELTSWYITDLKIAVSNDGNISAAGFYSEKGTSSIKGTFFMSLDPQTGKVLKQGTKNFDKDFMTEFMSDRKADKGNELYQYDLKKFYMRADGGATLLAEQYYITTVTTYSKNGSSTTYYYHYNDIIAVSINPDKSIEWAVRVPKQQVTANDGGYFSSFTSMTKGDNIYLFFNDNEKNMIPSGNKRIYPFNGKKSVVAAVVIDGNGKTKKSMLFSNKEQKMITRPKVCEQINGNEMLMLGEWRKKFKLLKVQVI